MLRDVRQWPQIPLRVTVGMALLYHSAPWVFTSTGHANFTHMLKTVGLPLPGLSAWAVGLLEVFGGLALVIGAFVPPVAKVLAIEIVVRITFIFLKGHGFPAPLPGESPLPGYETNLLYVGSLIALAIAGAGRCSVDWRRRLKAAESSGK